MAVPKRRRSSTKRKTRQSQDALTTKTLATCPNCGAKVLPHHVCPNCGQYKGQQVVAQEESK